MHNYGILGKKAPELEVEKWVDGHGNQIEPIHLSDFVGKPVVLFGFQSWCPGCHSHGLPSLKKLVELYKGKDVVFLAIQTVFEGFSSNTYEKMLEVQKQYNLEIPFGHDDGGSEYDRSSTMQSYKTGGTPWFTVLNNDHEVVFNDFHIDIDTIQALIDSL